MLISGFEFSKKYVKANGTVVIQVVIEGKWVFRSRKCQIFVLNAKGGFLVEEKKIIFLYFSPDTEKGVVGVCGLMVSSRA